MKRSLSKLVLPLVLLATISFASQAAAQDPAGEWLGALDLGAAKLRLALHVEKSDKPVSFLVLLAPPGEPLRSLLMRQTRELYRLQGLDQKLIDRALAAQAEDLELIADPSLTVDQIQEKLRARAEIRRTQFTAEERARLGINGDSIEQAIRVSTTAWFRSLIRQDPAAYLRNVKIPVLALFGDKDFQVDAQVNAEAVRAALAAAGNPDYDVRRLPGLNHLFQHAGTGGIEEYATIEETFAAEALSAVGDWIVARFPRAQSRKAGRHLDTH